MASRRLARVGLAITLVLVLGCSKSGTETVKVTGTVTLNGNPIEGVNVSFIPENGRPAAGVTDASGKFTLSTFKPGDGAVPGMHKVMIAEVVKEQPMPGTPEAKNWKPAEPRFPAKYADPGQSGFTADVGSTTDFNFDMKSE